MGAKFPTPAPPASEQPPLPPAPPLPHESSAAYRARTSHDFQAGDEITIEWIHAPKGEAEKRLIDGWFGGVRSDGRIVLFLFMEPQRVARCVFGPGDMSRISRRLIPAPFPQ